MMRVLLVDDHAALREPLAFLFDNAEGFEVVAHAGSLAEARTMLDGVDLAVLDLDLPDGLGTELIEDLRARNPSVLVMVLTGISERMQLALAIEAGAAGVISKSLRPEEIVGAARRLCEGETLLSSQEVLDALRLIGHRRRQEDDAQAKIEDLTRREREVLQVLAEGLSDKEIAARLHVGVGTVHSHMEKVLEKLKVSSRLQALVFAVRQGLVKLD